MFTLAKDKLSLDIAMDSLRRKFYSGVQPIDEHDKAFFYQAKSAIFESKFIEMVRDKRSDPATIKRYLSRCTSAYQEALNYVRNILDQESRGIESAATD